MGSNGLLVGKQGYEDLLCVVILFRDVTELILLFVNKPDPVLTNLGKPTSRPTK